MNYSSRSDFYIVPNRNVSKDDTAYMNRNIISYYSSFSNDNSMSMIYKKSLSNGWKGIFVFCIQPS